MRTKEIVLIKEHIPSYLRREELGSLHHIDR
jgi:hypothetical protein